jgi:hypothetical protein
MATTYELGYVNHVILTGLAEKTVLPNIITAIKNTEKPGKLNQGVDVYIEMLTDITVKTYTATDAANRAEYQADKLTFTPINIVLTDEIYTMVDVDSRDNLILNKENYTDFAQEISYMINQLVKQVEGNVGVKLNGLAGDDLSTEALEGATNAAKGSEVISAFVEQSFLFDQNGVASDNRFAVVGREVFVWLNAAKELIDASSTGDAISSALRKAILGEVAGWTIVKSPAVDSRSVVFLNSDAFGIVSRAPGKNVSAPYSELASVTEAPIDLRVNVLSNGARNTTSILASTFVTVAELKEAGTSNKRAQKVNFTVAA